MTEDPHDPHDRAFFEQMRGCRDNYRKLADAIHQIVGLQPSCLDIGAGIGLQTARLMEIGWRSVIGAEHSEVARQMREPGVTMVPFDLTEIARNPQVAACVICTETAEHIPAEHADTIATVVTQHATDVIVWSAAVPGQEWPGHVNLQPPSYWLGKLQARGWVVDEARSWALRDQMIQTRAQHWAAADNFHVLVPTSQYKPLHFSVTSTALNAQRYVERCMRSVLHQSYEHWDHYVVDAASGDQTLKVARAFAKSSPRQFHVSANKILRRSALENAYNIWKDLPDDEVIVWLDGDDWLAGDRAFEVLARTYASPAEPWVTYGQFMQPNGEVSMANAYLPGSDVRSERWRATHLKTFRAGLVKQIDPKDLLRPDGKWMDLAIDRPVMYPLLELAGPHAVFIPNILYVYNTAASWESNHTPAERELEIAEAERVRAMPRYAQLTKRPW
jgi:hypothetical protein